MPRDEFIRLTEKMFPKWATETTKVAMFMQDLDPIKMYSIDEMKEYAETKAITHLNQFCKISNKGENNGMILKKTATGYQLFPELVAAFNKNF